MEFFVSKGTIVPVAAQSNLNSSRAPVATSAGAFEGTGSVRSTALIAQPVRPIVVLRVVSDPLSIPAGLLPTRCLYRLVGVFLGLADR
jgi:hypothetical protein